MKKVIILLAGILMSMLLIDSVFAQLEKGKSELSFGAAFMGVQQAEGSSFAVNISTRLGYFFTQQFEIEPEIIFTAYEHQDAGLILNANLLYNLPVAQGIKVVPFVLAGGGWANSVHLFNQINAGDVDRNHYILNLGLGTRYFLNSSVALRLEYRFQRFFPIKKPWEDAPPPGFNYHNVLVGLSFSF